jgi:hypothetical protein
MTLSMPQKAPIETMVYPPITTSGERRARTARPSAHPLAANCEANTAEPTGPVSRSEPRTPLTEAMPAPKGPRLAAATATGSGVARHRITPTNGIQTEDSKNKTARAPAAAEATQPFLASEKGSLTLSGC